MKELAAILGGNKTRSKKFPFRKTMGQEELNSVKDVIESDNLSSFLGSPGKNFLGGKKVIEFETIWKNKYDFKHAISINSWTSGLIIAVGAIGIGPGDEVICSPYTMSASATSVLFYGGIPIFADVEANTGNLNPESIEKSITERTKAIIIVHIFGGTADMDPIMKIAKKYNLKVIEDAAQAPGTFYKGKPIGTIGDIGGFSLNYHKHIHCGEGGMLVTNDDELALRCQLIRNHGENCADEKNIPGLDNIIGGNYRLTEISAAIGIEQFKKLNSKLDVRKKLANYLHNELKEIECISSYPPKKNFDHVYYVFPMIFDEKIAGMSRNIFVKAVNKEFPDAEGWESTPMAEGYVKPLYLNKIYQKKIAIGKTGFPFNYNEVEYSYKKGLCPVTEDLYYNKMIITPLIRDPLSTNDILDLVNAIKKVLSNSKKITELVDKDVKISTPVSVAASKNVR